MTVIFSGTRVIRGSLRLAPNIKRETGSGFVRSYIFNLFVVSVERVNKLNLNT